MNYNNKTFKPIASSSNSDTSSETVFLYQQRGHVLTGTYQGGTIITGHLIGTVNEQGVIDMRYHHVTTEGLLQTGICTSTPERLPNGKIRLHETWTWTSGDCSTGHSKLDEV